MCSLSVFSGGLFFTPAEVGGVAGAAGMGVIAEHFGGFDAAVTGAALVYMLLVGLAVANYKLAK